MIALEQTLAELHSALRADISDRPITVSAYNKRVASELIEAGVVQDPATVGVYPGENLTIMGTVQSALTDQLGLTVLHGLQDDYVVLPMTDLPADVLTDTDQHREALRIVGNHYSLGPRDAEYTPRELHQSITDLVHVSKRNLPDEREADFVNRAYAHLYSRVNIKPGLDDPAPVSATVALVRHTIDQLR